MKYAVFILNLFVLVYYVFLAKKRSHPLVFFCSLWMLLSLFSSLELYGLFSVSRQMWSYILLGEVAFLAPFLLNITVRKREAGLRTTETVSGSTGMNYLFLDGAILVIMILSIIEIYGAVRQYLSGMDMGEVRAAYFGYGENASNTKITTVLHTYISEPLRVALRPIIIVDFLMLSHNRVRFGMELFLLASGVVISGGRFELAYFLVQFLIIYLLFAKDKNSEGSITKTWRRKKTKNVLIFSAFMVLMIGLVGWWRGSSNLWETIYLSLAEPLINCNIRIIGLQENAVRSFYGLVSFRGILNPLFFLLKQIGIISYPQLYLTAGDYMNTQDYISIGANIKTNAYVTPLYDLYLDGGVFGIVMGMLILGIITKTVYFSFKRKNANGAVDARSVALYLIIINSIIQMLHTLAWAHTSYTIAVVFIFLFTNRYSEHIRNKG